MQALKWIVAGFLGGAVGAAAWAAAAHFINAELGVIAWGIGFLVGGCVRLAARPAWGAGPGSVAVAISWLAILAGKYAAAALAAPGRAWDALATNFTAFDILWFVLATLTAYRLGSNAVTRP